MRNTLLAGGMLVVLSCCPPARAGAIYKCQNPNGQTTFSDTPCSAKAEVVTPRKTSFGGGSATWCDDGAASPDLINACLEKWRGVALDPHSTYADSGELVHMQEGKKRLILLDGHARNRMGGFNSVQMQCEVDANGGIDAAGTDYFVKFEQLSEEVNAKERLFTPKKCESVSTVRDDTAH